MLARDYAQGLYDLRGKAEHLPRLREILKRRGHTKLLPQILEEYKKLVEHDERLEIHQTETPKQAQTRHLLELYRKLTA